MSKGNSLQDLFLETLKDIYYAEKKILRSLPKMAKAAESDEVKESFRLHREQTEGQIQRLEQVFEQLGKTARGKTCDAILGILAEGEDAMESYEGAPALDAALIASAQAVEHYEIARYGTLKNWATQLGMTEAAALLQENLQEEEATDKLLSKMSKAANKKAAA
ncbi:YciE/YciF ferroxidase family protein [Geminicoccus roseus]|uniref:YciE/YciF ferroxidase family protein n=1 Tax=Geminicoccus roseus TaxID=404900 RepID=UPI0003FCCD4F|nr:ferritin-like domain-containing protein [Geminicoccus roseus]